MKKYKKKCGLTRKEFELEKLVDAVRSETSTLICIKILERGFKKLNTPRVSKSKAKCEHNWQECTHKAVWMFSKCTKCGEIK